MGGAVGRRNIFCTWRKGLRQMQYRAGEREENPQTSALIHGDQESCGPNLDGGGVTCSRGNSEPRERPGKDVAGAGAVTYFLRQEPPESRAQGCTTGRKFIRLEQSAAYYSCCFIVNIFPAMRQIKTKLIDYCPYVISTARLRRCLCLHLPFSLSRPRQNFLPQDCFSS